MHRAYLDAAVNGWAKQPIIEMLIPSTLDSTLAPKGRHVASLFCQHFRFDLGPGRSWDNEREKAADQIIATVDAHAPGFAKSVLGRQIHSPLDLERRFGLIGGDIFHGKMGLDQLFSARPMIGAADYRMPLKGLYLCGSGAHPGGGVTGAPGSQCRARGAQRPALLEPAALKPLEGIKVLDLSRVLAGPWCTQLLADLGAEVIKIERPGAGDDTRHWGPPWHGEGERRVAAYFLSCNRGKKSAAIDFAQPEGAANLSANSPPRRMSWSRTSRSAAWRSSVSTPRRCARPIRGWSTPRSPASARMALTRIAPATTSSSRAWAA